MGRQNQQTEIHIIREIRAGTHLVDPGGRSKTTWNSGPTSAMGHSLHLQQHQQQEERQQQSDSITPLSQPGGNKIKASSFRHPRPQGGTFFRWDSPSEASAEGRTAAAVRPREPPQHHGRRRTLVTTGGADERQPAGGPSDQTLASGARWPRNPSP
jgi:hypothetical protein